MSNGRFCTFIVILCFTFTLSRPLLAEQKKDDEPGCLPAFAALVGGIAGVGVLPLYLQYRISGDEDHFLADYFNEIDELFEHYELWWQSRLQRGLEREKERNGE